MTCFYDDDVIIVNIIDMSRLPQRADPNVENKGKKVYRTITGEMFSASLYLHVVSFKVGNC